jgi:hypothetical protein
MSPNRIHLGTALIVAALVASACTSLPVSTSRVFFIEPVDGARVESPVHVEMGADNFTVEPAGAVKSGAGHLHIMVDADCIAAGQEIPKDETTHLHFGDGQTETDLDLAPGTHRLCLQAGNGEHMALAGPGMQHQITVTVP